MQTLVERLRAPAPQTLSRKNRERLTIAKIHDFYSEEPFAAAVAKEEASYETSVYALRKRLREIQPRNTLLVPAADSALDEELDAVLQSMNSVGKAPVNYELLKTAGKGIFRLDGLSAFIGAGMTATPLLAIASWSENGPLEQPLIYAGSLALGCFAYRQFTQKGAEFRAEAIEHMHTAAAKTDVFLRGLNKKYVL